MLSMAFSAIVQGEPDPAMTSPALPPDPAPASDPRPGAARFGGGVPAKRRSWAKGSVSWRDGVSRDRASRDRPARGHSYNGDVSADTSPTQNGGYSFPTSVHEWLDESVNCSESSAAETSTLCSRGSVGSEDDLSLGAEAGSIRESSAISVDPSSGGARRRASSSEHPDRPMALLAPTRNVPLGGANMGSSFNSGHSALSAGSVSNLNELLDLRDDDPEGLLLELGFGEEEEDVAARVPPRFFSAPSAARGIDLGVFLRAQLQRMDEESPTVTSRFRQVEVLAKVTDTFSSLYSHVRVRREQSVTEPPDSPHSPLLGGAATAVASRATQNLLCRKRWQKKCNDGGGSGIAADRSVSDGDDGTPDGVGGGGGGGGGDAGSPTRRGGRLRKVSRLAESPLRLEPLVEEDSAGGGVSPVLPGALAFSFVEPAELAYGTLELGICATPNAPVPVRVLANGVTGAAAAAANDPYPVFNDEKEHLESVPEAEDHRFGPPGSSIDVDATRGKEVSLEDSDPSSAALELKCPLDYDDNTVDGSADSSNVLLPPHAVNSHTGEGDVRGRAIIKQGGAGRAGTQTAVAASAQVADDLCKDPADPEEAPSRQSLPHRRTAGRRHAGSPQQARSLSSDDSQDLSMPFEGCDRGELIMGPEDGERSPEPVACVTHKVDGPLEQCRRQLTENLRTNSMQSDSSGFVDDSSIDLNPKRNAELFCSSHVEMGSSMESSDSCVTVRWVGAKQAEAAARLSPTSPDVSEASFLTTVSDWDVETREEEEEEENGKGEMQEILTREEVVQDGGIREADIQEGETQDRESQERETQGEDMWTLESPEDEEQEEEMWEEDSAMASPGTDHSISTSPCDLSESDGAKLNGVDGGDPSSRRCLPQGGQSGSRGVDTSMFEIYLIFSDDLHEEGGSQSKLKPPGSLTHAPGEIFETDLESNGKLGMERNPRRGLTEEIKLEDMREGLSPELAMNGEERFTHSRDALHGDVGKTSIPLVRIGDSLPNSGVSPINAGDPAKRRSRPQGADDIDLQASGSDSESPDSRRTRTDDDECHVRALEASASGFREYIPRLRTRRLASGVLHEQHQQREWRAPATLADCDQNSDRGLEEAFDVEVHDGLDPEKSLSDSEQSSNLEGSDATGPADESVQIPASPCDHDDITRATTRNDSLTSSHKTVSFATAPRSRCSGTSYVPPSVAKKIQTSLRRVSLRDGEQHGEPAEAETPPRETPLNTTLPLKLTSPLAAEPPYPASLMANGLSPSERPSPAAGNPTVTWVESPRVISSNLVTDGASGPAARVPRHAQAAAGGSSASRGKEKKRPPRGVQSATRRVERNPERGDGTDGGSADGRATTCRTELFVPLQRGRHKRWDGSCQPWRHHSCSGDDDDAAFARSRYACTSSCGSSPCHPTCQPCWPEHHPAYHHHHHHHAMRLCHECGAAPFPQARWPCFPATCAAIDPCCGAPPCPPWGAPQYPPPWGAPQYPPPWGHGASHARTLEAQLTEVLCGIQLALRGVVTTTSWVGGGSATDVAEPCEDFEERRRLRAERALREVDTVQSDLLRFEQQMRELERQTDAQPPTTPQHRREWERLRALRDDVRTELARLQERLRERRRALEGRQRTQPARRSAVAGSSDKSPGSPFLQHMVSELLQEQASLKLEILEAEEQQRDSRRGRGDADAESAAELGVERGERRLSPSPEEAEEEDARPRRGRHLTAGDVPTYRPHGPLRDAARREGGLESPASRPSSGGSRDGASVSHAELLYLLKTMKDSMLQEVHKEMLDNMRPFLTGAEFSTSLREDLES